MGVNILTCNAIHVLYIELVVIQSVQDFVEGFFVVVFVIVVTQNA